MILQALGPISCVLSRTVRNHPLRLGGFSFSRVLETIIETLFWLCFKPHCTKISPHPAPTKNFLKRTVRTKMMSLGRICGPGCPGLLWYVVLPNFCSPVPIYKPSLFATTFSATSQRAHTSSRDARYTPLQGAYVRLRRTPGPKGAFGAQGALGVIPELFQMESNFELSHFEWSSSFPFRNLRPRKQYNARDT